MDPRRRPVMAGNWKMHKGIHETGGFVRELVAALKERPAPPDCEVVIAPVFTSLAVAQQAAWGSPLKVAAQNCHWAPQGAFTGEISAAMLKEVGISHVILGHSERRQHFGETDASVHDRLAAALDEGLVPIVCIGETLDEREAGATQEVIRRQLDGALEGLPPERLGSLILAYEPVWAIGTGRVATALQAQEAHAWVRGRLRETHGYALADAVRLLYGGSANPDNVAELLACPDVDGCLVGGASLKGPAFMAMVDAARRGAAPG